MKGEGMLTVHRNQIEAMIEAALRVHADISDHEVRELVITSPRTAYGKKDTLALDAIPERVYIKCTEEYDSRSILVTEETDEITRRNLPATWDRKLQPTVLISDPIDRSKQYKEFLMILANRDYLEKTSGPTKGGENIPEQTIEKIEKDSQSIKDFFNQIFDYQKVKVRELWEKYDIVKEWSKLYGTPSSIAGATSAITCIFRGRAVASVILNMITGNVTVACELGIFSFKISDFELKPRTTLRDVFEKSQKISFPPIAANHNKQQPIREDASRIFVTYCGKEGYPEHFQSALIHLGRTGVEDYLHYDLPGGPSRPLYLSNLQPAKEPIGFIMSNGEKITEWIHWLPFVKYAFDSSGRRELAIFEAYMENSMQKKGIPMSVSPSLSLFVERDGHGKFLHINRIGFYVNPSHFRSVIIICPTNNSWLTEKMAFYGFREISSYF